MDLVNINFNDKSIRRNGQSLIYQKGSPRRTIGHELSVSQLGLARSVPRTVHPRLLSAHPPSCN